MAFELDNGTPLPANFLRLVDQATANLSDKERMIFLQAVALTMNHVTRELTDFTLNLKNATPDLLRGPVTVRRIGL